MTERPFNLENWQTPAEAEQQRELCRSEMKAEGTSTGVQKAMEHFWKMLDKFHPKPTKQ